MDHKLVQAPELEKLFRILLAFSGLRHALTTNPGYNMRAAECQEAAKVLLTASGNSELEPTLCNVEHAVYEAHKHELKPVLARRAEHYFSENMRVTKGLEAWASGNLEEFGKLISASGLSSIENYECDSSLGYKFWEFWWRCGATDSAIQDSSEGTRCIWSSVQWCRIQGMLSGLCRCRKS